MPPSFWDEKFARPDYLFGTDPNAFVVSEAWRMAPGHRVLAVGDGEGRNGVWLAQRGLKVTSIDSSLVGIAKSKNLARERGVFLETICADLTIWDWPSAAFDAVVLIFVHFTPEARRHVHTGIMRSLVPGGTLILECYTPAQLNNKSGGPRDPDMLYTKDALAQDFAGAEILHLEEISYDLNEGERHKGPAEVVRLVARKA